MYFWTDTYPAARFCLSTLSAPFLLLFLTTILVEERLGIFGSIFLVSLLNKHPSMTLPDLRVSVQETRLHRFIICCFIDKHTCVLVS
jgi:hypothetical protein